MWDKLAEGTVREKQGRKRDIEREGEIRERERERGERDI